MHSSPNTSNTHASVATQFCNSHFVSRTNHFTIAQGVTRVLSSMDTPAPVADGSREHHQVEAMKAAEKIPHQFTAQAKKQAKRECLGHLIASLAKPEKGDRS